MNEQPSAIIASEESEGAKVSSIPVVRELRRNDLWDALMLGWRDFWRAPQYGLFFGHTQPSQNIPHLPHLSLLELLYFNKKMNYKEQNKKEK